MVELAKILVFITGLLPGAIIVLSLFTTLVTYLLAPKYDFYVKKVDIMGHVFERNGAEEKFEHYKEKFVPLSSCSTALDLTKPIPEVFAQNDTKLTMATSLWTYIPWIIIAIPCIYWLNWSNPKGILLWVVYFLIGMAIGFIFHGIFGIVRAIRVVRSCKKGIIKEIYSYQRMIQSGIPLRQMRIPPLDESKYPGCTFADKLMYLTFYCLQLLDDQMNGISRMEEMRTATGKMREIIDQQPYTRTMIPFYGWLVFYYSTVEVDKNLSKIYLEKTGKAFYEDKDANSKRILACYYASIGDLANARRYTDEGLAVVDKFSMYGERDLERKLLERIDEKIKNATKNSKK